MRLERFVKKSGQCICTLRSWNCQTPPARFHGHFPGEPGLAIIYWSKGWWKW